MFFHVSSYFNLNFDIKQFKIGWKFAKQWLPKAKISGRAYDRGPDFVEKCTNSKQLTSNQMKELFWDTR